MSDCWEIDFGEVGVLVNVVYVRMCFCDQSIIVGVMLFYFMKNLFEGYDMLICIFFEFWMLGLEEGLFFVVGLILDINGVDVEYYFFCDVIFGIDKYGDCECLVVSVLL